jgi:hypothetical protein
MFKALILVRNFESSSETLDFGEFTVERIGFRFTKLREDLSSADVNQDDWILEKLYSTLPPGAPGSPVGGIPTDIEDLLLLLRLFRPGDVSFTKQAIIPPSGNVIVQFPYRAMNDLNSYSLSRFRIEPEECKAWKAFADRLRQSQSWKSNWFTTARRFFLSGGAKEFNPKWDDVDRIADYATALEATLVPEKDYNTRRISHRAGTLLAQDGVGEIAAIGSFVKRLYDIRSRIVHGSTIDDKTRDWLSDNWDQIDIRMRQILVAAVTQLPPDDEGRRKALSGLYDLTDKDRGDFVLEKFKEIKSSDVRKLTAAKITESAGL